MKNGIDISYGQKGIDLTAAKAAGIEFTIIRAGISTRTDTEFITNTENAVKAGLPYGFYWYSRAFSTEEAGAEASICITAIKSYEPLYPIFYDMESQDQIEKLDKAARTAIITAFCNKIRAAGYTAGVYINPSWMENYVDKTQLVGKYDIWLANWTNDPNVPAKYNYGQAIWQWGLGNISGMNVDCDICYKDYVKEEQTKIPLGTVVNFAGGMQYASSESTTGSKANAGTVKITNRAKDAIHYYHVISTDGSGVYGWVDADKLSLKDAETDAYTAGQAVELKNAGLYAASGAAKPVNTVSGTYYLYDGKNTNGFLRISPSIANVGKTPISDNVTGWIKTEDIK